MDVLMERGVSSRDEFSS